MEFQHILVAGGGLSSSGGLRKVDEMKMDGGLSRTRRRNPDSLTLQSPASLFVSSKAIFDFYFML